MKLLHFYFFCIVSLATQVFASGWQGCKERIYAWQAFEIDGLLPAEQQTIGFRCNQWDKDHGCVGDYVQCRKADGSRCDFDGLMYSLGGTTQQTGWRVNKEDGSLDPEASALKCLEKFKQEPDPKMRKVYNCPGYNVIKNGVDDWNACIRHIGDKINTVYKEYKTDVNGHLWDDADDTRRSIVKIRVGDNGPFLIQQLKPKLPGVTFYELDLGNNPAKDNQKLIGVDWKKTILTAEQSDPEFRQKLRTELNYWYRDDIPEGTSTRLKKKIESTRSHQQLLRVYKGVSDRTNRCRKTGPNP